MNINASIISSRLVKDETPRSWPIGKSLLYVNKSFLIQLVLYRTLNELSGTLASHQLLFEDNPISVQRFGALIDLVQNRVITGEFNI
jgi:Asp-tRNA(Asn)/Glu-tRNA(Gln) amidotransferase B subunit